MWNLVLVRLETVLESVQHMCTVCAECTILLEIVLDAPDDTPRYEAQLEACLCLFGDRASLSAR
jgi:hypothetical protein